MPADQLLEGDPVPVPGQPSIFARYEKRAAGRGGLAAIRAVLAEIDRTPAPAVPGAR